MRISDWSSDVCSSDLRRVPDINAGPLWPGNFFGRLHMNSTTGGSAPRSLLAKADEWLGKVETGLNFVAAFFILALMFLGVANVVGRKLFDHPVAGYIDIVEVRSEEHTSELQSLMRISYAVLCLKQK